jgi:hypothetical protein
VIEPKKKKKESQSGRRLANDKHNRLKEVVYVVPSQVPFEVGWYPLRQHVTLACPVMVHVELLLHPPLFTPHGSEQAVLLAWHAHARMSGGVPMQMDSGPQVSSQMLS